MLMKRSKILALSAVFLICGLAAAAFAAEPGSVVVQKEKGLIDWSQGYIEAIGAEAAPKGTSGAQARALARRGAIVDLQRNLLEFVCGVQVDARTTMDDFMANDRVRTEVSGMIKNVELLEGQWDGEAYTVTGRIKLAEVRVIVAPHIPQEPAIKIIVEEERKPSTPKTAGRFTGLVIDVRHLPLVPSLTFRVFDENGRAVYGMEFVDQTFFLQSSSCSYMNNINYANGDVFVASNPITVKAIRLSSGNVDIVIPNSAAAKVRGSSYDFRRECKVIVVVNG